MKIVKNILKIIIVLIIFQITFIPISNANTWGEIINSGKDFIEDGSEASNADESGINQTKLEDAINKIYNLLLALGVVISVIIGAILGIKFMVGSVEEQAKIKETLLPYVTGCIVVFGAFAIWKLIMVALSNI